MLIIKGLERSWCVTSNNVCSYSPLRLYCMKVHFSGCDAALHRIYKRSRSPPLPTVATRASRCTRTLSHWHMDGTWTMSEGLKPTGPESHTSIVLVASHRCRTHQQLSTSFFFFPLPFFFFFFLLNLSHTSSLPLLMWDGRRKRWAICTTLSWIVLRCLAVAAVTDDRLRSFVCVCVYPSKEVAGEEKRDWGKEGGRVREVGCHPLKTQELGMASREIIELGDRLWHKTLM